MPERMDPAEAAGRGREGAPVTAGGAGDQTCTSASPCACGHPSRPGEHTELRCRMETTWGELTCDAPVPGLRDTDTEDTDA